MGAERWALYGAYGYTGQLLAELAQSRGHVPTLMGRSSQKLTPLAQRLGLPSVAVDLEDARALRGALEGHALVLHAAGPFIHTAKPMREACLDVGAHYLDITGEIQVFEDSFAEDRRARERNVAIISGVGFDVVPTDCLARYVSEKIPDPWTLELVISVIGQPSGGTTRSAIEALPRGNFVRRDGHLVSRTLGKASIRAPFPHGEKTAISIPWGDLVTGFHTTGIPNITTYMTVPTKQAQALRLAGWAVPTVLRADRVRSLVLALVEKSVKGPDAQARARGRSFVFARARNTRGDEATAWLETVDGYVFTAEAGIRAVEKTLALQPRGSLTPARAFGSDFVLEVPDTRRLDTLGA